MSILKIFTLDFRPLASITLVLATFKFLAISSQASLFALPSIAGDFRNISQISPFSSVVFIINGPFLEFGLILFHEFDMAQQSYLFLLISLRMIYPQLP